MKSGTEAQVVSLLMLAIVLIIVLVSARFGVPLVVRYVKTLTSGYGFGKQPQVADIARAPSKQPKDNHEPAYDHYLVGQAWWDFRHAHLRALTAFGDMLRKSWQDI